MSVALITGASQGIGRNIVNKLAENGYKTVITAKTITPTINLPGTIFDVQVELLEKHGASSMAMPLDVRDVSQMKKVVKEIITTYGKIDAVIHNAGALHWKSIEQTYYNNYDLINSINSRASFLLSQMCLKYMKHDGYGHIIMHSPPLPNSCLL